MSCSIAVSFVSKCRLVISEPSVRALERSQVLCRNLATSGAKRKFKKEGILKKRGASAAKASQSNEATGVAQQAPKKQGTPPPAVLILVIFPLLATGILVAFRPDLQDEIKANWGHAQSSKETPIKNES